MKFFLRFVAPVLAILWLAQVHPLGAVLAIVLCIIRCAFKSRMFSHILAHAFYDILKGTAAGTVRLAFGRRRRRQTGVTGNGTISSPRDRPRLTELTLL